MCQVALVSAVSVAVFCVFSSAFFLFRRALFFWRIFTLNRACLLLLLFFGTPSPFKDVLIVRKENAVASLKGPFLLNAGITSCIWLAAVTKFIES